MTSPTVDPYHLERFVQAQQQAYAGARSRPYAFVDQMLGIDFTQSLQCEGRGRALHAGHTPRPLHECAMRKSC